MGYDRYHWDVQRVPAVTDAEGSCYSLSPPEHSPRGTGLESCLWGSNLSLLRGWWLLQWLSHSPLGSETEALSCPPSLALTQVLGAARVPAPGVRDLSPSQLPPPLPPASGAHTGFHRSHSMCPTLGSQGVPAAHPPMSHTEVASRHL